MKEIDAMIQAVNDLVSIKNDTREEVLSDVLADCQSGWVENIRDVSSAIDDLRKIAGLRNPDTTAIRLGLNCIMMKITSSIGDVKSYDAIKNTIRNMD